MIKLLRYALAILVVIGFSEISPKFINAILVLLIAGVILGNFTKFQWFTDFISKIGGE